MARQLEFVLPMECLHTERLPEGPDWIYEVKLDGYRAQALHAGKATRLLSRNGKDLGGRFPGVVVALAGALPPGSVLDGELVALDEAGRPSFSLIQNSASSGATFVFFAFDLMFLAGRDLTDEPLAERRRLLKANLQDSDTVQLSESFSIPAAQMLALVREHSLEGVVAKRLTSRYELGARSGAWVKLRLNLGQEFVIGGYTPGTHGFDAVVIGFYRGKDLHFCAKVRAGFVPASRRELFKQLAPLSNEVCPFVNLPEKGEGRWAQGLTSAKMAECVWLRPETVAQFTFLEWTPADHLRHVSFVAVRNDKEPYAVVKEGEATVNSKKPPQKVSEASPKSEADQNPVATRFAAV